MVRFASKRDKREGVCEHLCAGDPGHGGAVATTTGKDPGPSAGVAVGAKRPLEFITRSRGYRQSSYRNAT